MTDATAQSARVLALAKAGDVAGAIGAGEALFAGGSQDAALSLFVGMLCGRQGEVDRGLMHVRRSVALMPNNAMARIELARMLLISGRFDEARDIAGPEGSLGTPAGREMLRIEAHALRHCGKADEARLIYESLTSADPADFESWDGIGLACLALGQAGPAIPAFQNAIRQRPASATYRTHLANAYAAAERYPEGADAAREAIARDPASAAPRMQLAHCLVKLERGPEALAAAAAARRLAPADAEMLLKAATVEIDLKDFADGEATLRQVISLAPELASGWIALGALFERMNRMADLGAMLDEAQAAGIIDDALALLRARFLRSEDRLEEALAVAQAAGPGDDPIGRAQLIGQIADRLGETAVAFSAFSEASAGLAIREADAEAKAEAYLQQLAKLTEILTPQWYGGWSSLQPAAPRRSPLFIFGFPRSGTTLIDTMLGGHPEAVVLEEEPIIFRLSDALGPVEKLPNLSPNETAALRLRYFSEVDRIEPGIGDRLIVDKNPLGLGNTLLCHRLFPDARYVFVERHPYDVVLSCFITSARLNNNVATFSSLVGIARLYDEVLRYWNRCCAVLPIATYRIRYEKLIEDPERELRPLAAFAGLSWDDRLLTNEANAAERKYIASPSYAQVSQPIYSRAAGRWRRYRQYFGPVTEILDPWVELMGYALD